MSARAVVAAILLSFTAWGAALPADQPVVMGAAAPADLPAAWESRCADPGSAACVALRALMIDQLLVDLETLEGTNDRRAVEGARAVIAIDDPDVQASAIRILVRHWGPAPFDYAADVAPLLLSETPRVQRLAVQALPRSADPRARALAEEWRRNHPDLDSDAADLDAIYAAPDPAARKFKPYPGSRPFPPADGAGSIGFATADPIEKVFAFYRTPGSSGPTGFDEFLEVAGEGIGEEPSEEEQEALNRESEANEKELEAIAKEMEAAMKGGQIDAAAMQRATERMTAVQAKMAEGFMAQAGILNALPPRAAEEEDARFLIVESREERVLRAVMAVPDPLVGLTIVRLLWDPAARP